LIPTESSQSESAIITLPVFVISSSPEDTKALGMRLASLLGSGTVVALRGPLGAGKTCLVKGIAKGLGICEEVTSPTYTIISEYLSCITPKPLPFYHIDAYRLKEDDDFSAIGGEEIVFGSGISVIEWCEHIPAFVPLDAIRVDLEITRDDKRRILVYKGELPSLEYGN
jgi:tRNA threonylcarbamoyladenosine biosynthesis protein TsaE